MVRGFQLSDFHSIPDLGWILANGEETAVVSHPVNKEGLSTEGGQGTLNGQLKLKSAICMHTNEINRLPIYMRIKTNGHAIYVRHTMIVWSLSRCMIRQREP